MIANRNIWILFACLLTWQCCKKDPAIDEEADIVAIEYNPAMWQLNTPPGFPELIQPDDNMVTAQGIELGRKLFYDPLLSVDSTVSCSTCHLAKSSFTDDLAVSVGVDGATGHRSSMSLLNVAYYDKGLFWAGRSPSLEEQALHPIEDLKEMINTWENVEDRLQKHPSYPFDFRRAFGITKRADITRDLVTKALAQFERTMLSSGTSRFDRFIRGEIGMDEDEIAGYQMFFDLVDELPDAECGHCHSQPLFTTNEYFNNGLDAVDDLADFVDLGRGEVINDRIKNGMFRVPTLRNITLTAPYMHDGRFNTLEEVIEHYSEGGELSPNKHPLITKLQLNGFQKQQLVKFLHTLTDTVFTQDPALSNPF